MRRPIAPVLTVTCVAAMLTLDRTLAGPRPLRFPLSLSGLVPMAAGLALALVARRRFVRAGTGLHPLAEPDRLVVEGPFRYSRNPMYLGLSMFLLGVAFALGSCAPFGACVAFVGLVDRAYIPAEERTLSRVFGSEYEWYRARTRRWI